MQTPQSTSRCPHRSCLAPASQRPLPMLLRGARSFLAASLACLFSPASPAHPHQLRSPPRARAWRLPHRHRLFPSPPRPPCWLAPPPSLSSPSLFSSSLPSSFPPPLPRPCLYMPYPCLPPLPPLPPPSSPGVHRGRSRYERRVMGTSFTCCGPTLMGTGKWVYIIL